MLIPTRFRLYLKRSQVQAVTGMEIRAGMPVNATKGCLVAEEHTQWDVASRLVDELHGGSGNFVDRW